MKQKPRKKTGPEKGVAYGARPSSRFVKLNLLKIVHRIGPASTTQILAETNSNRVSVRNALIQMKNEDMITGNIVGNKWIFNKIEEEQ